MCGLTGLASKSVILPYKNDFLEAHKIIRHRGPDGEGIALFNPNKRYPIFISHRKEEAGNESQWKDAKVAFGHRRLAIIDLSETGAQPMASDDGGLSIIFNGEIYNYLEIKEDLTRLGHVFRSESDTEVILHAYQEWGESCVQQFNGMWAFAIIDLYQKRIFCSRDRFGVKPFHYFHDGNLFVFGSEIKQLLCFPFIKRKANQNSIANYLVSGTTDVFDQTFICDIHRLSQGCNLIYTLEEGHLHVDQYYNPKLIINDHISRRDAADQFRNLLIDSVRLRLRSDVEVGSCLSGGLDSSSIVCIMNKLLREKNQDSKQHTFSSHFEDEEANELNYMQTVIDHTGVKPFFIYPNAHQLQEDLQKLVWHQDEPFGSTSIFAQWSVFKLVQRHKVKVILDGQGADEMLAGYISLSYEFFRELREKKAYLSLFWEAFRFLQFHPDQHSRLIEKFLSSKVINRITSSLCLSPHQKSPSFLDLLQTLNPKLLSSWKNSQEINEKEVFDKKELLNNLLYRFTFFANLQSLLRYEDRNSMAFSVESRVPFLDYRLVEFAFSLPSDFKIHNGNTKKVLRDSMAGILPEKIRWRRGKLGFATPEKKWQVKVLKPMINAVIHSDRLRDFIEPSSAAEYVQASMRKDGVDFAPWRWVNLYYWLEIFNIEK